MRNVGELIKERRQEIGMSKVALAKKLGCSPQNIDSLERRKSIDFELAQKISLIMGFDLFGYYRLSDPERDNVILDLKKTIENLTEKYVRQLEKNNELLERINQISELNYDKTSL